MDWKKFAKGETSSSKEELSSIDSLDEKKVSLREFTDYENNKKRERKDSNTSKKIQTKMERQGFINPSRATQHAYETLRISSGFDRFVNYSGLLTTFDTSKQAAFNYYNNQLQHNMMLASQNDELIKQNDVVINQNEEIIKLLSQIANK